MIDRQQDPNYINTVPRAESDVLSVMGNVWQNCQPLQQQMWREQALDVACKIGDPSFWSSYYRWMTPGTKQLFFNRTRRIVNMVSGYQRRNRKSGIVVPVFEERNQFASQLTKLAYQMRYACEEDEVFSDSFEQNSLTTGFGLIELGLNYSKDPFVGDVYSEIVPYNEVMVDPWHRRKDLSDASFIWRRIWRTKQQLMEMFPDIRDELKRLPETQEQDGKFNFLMQAFNWARRGQLALDEYWYQASRTGIFLMDEERHLFMEWQKDMGDYRAFLEAYPTVQVVKREIPTVRCAMVCNNRVLYDGPNPLGIDEYPFIPFYGYFEQNAAYPSYRAQGMVRGVRDAQFLYNRRKVIELDILESQINSGYIYKAASLIDPDSVFLQGQGKGIALKREAEITDVQKIPPGDLPNNVLQLSEMLAREINEISGVNEELLGMADDDKAGILSMLRQSAGLTTLQSLLDNADFALKRLTELKLQIAMKNYPYGKIERLIGEKPTEEWKYRIFSPYEVRVEEGTNTTTQRQLEFQQLDYLHRELGFPVPPENFIRTMTVQNKDELIASIQQSQQAQQQSQMEQMQAQVALLRSQMEELNSRSAYNYGRQAENMSRINLNEQSAAEKNAQAQLDMVKSYKEMQMMDLESAEKVVDIADKLQENLPDQNKGVD